MFQIALFTKTIWLVIFTISQKYCIYSHQFGKAVNCDIWGLLHRIHYNVEESLYGFRDKFSIADEVIAETLSVILDKKCELLFLIIHLWCETWKIKADVKVNWLRDMPATFRFFAIKIGNQPDLKRSSDATSRLVCVTFHAFLIMSTHRGLSQVVPF